MTFDKQTKYTHIYIYIYYTSTSSETYDIIYPVLDLKASDTYKYNKQTKQHLINLFVCYQIYYYLIVQIEPLQVNKTLLTNIK